MNQTNHEDDAVANRLYACPNCGEIVTTLLAKAKMHPTVSNTCHHCGCRYAISGFIFFAGYLVLVVFCIGVPVLTSFSGNTKILSALVGLIAYITLLTTAPLKIKKP